MKPKKNLLTNGPRLGGACLSLLLITFCGQTLHAADWVGGTVGAEQDWNTGSNWTGGTLPNAGTDWANIFSGPSNVPVISADSTGSPVAIGIGGNSRLDHTAGILTGTASDWPGGSMLIGMYGAAGTYNLANTGTTGGTFTGYGTGSGSFATGEWGSINLGAGWWWDHSTAVMNINTSGTVNSIGQMNIAGKSGDVATANLDAGTVTIHGGWQESLLVGCIAGAATDSTGSMNISGGTVTLDHRLTIGKGSTTYTRTGAGTVEDPYVYSDFLYANGSTTGTVTMTGGTLTCQTVYNTNGDAESWHAGVGMASGYDGSTGGTATFNLNGGTLSTVFVFSEAPDGNDGNGAPYDSTIGTSTFNFNGGTLQAQAAPQGWLPLMYGLTRANVRDGGAVIDTNGNNRSMSQALDHSDIEGDAPTDGGLTKTGAGQLNLASGNTYNGNTTVNAGTLSVQSTSFDDASTITIADGATLNLNTGATDTVGSLVLGVGTQPNGTYGAIGSGAQHEIAQITGNGFIQVGPPASGYSAWASNVNGDTADLDSNSDGVDNGIAYFMNDTGVISLPGIVGGAVTWTNGGNIDASQYGTEFVIQTSQDLVNWADVPSSSLTANENGPDGSLTYTPPTGQGKWFVRLVVTPN